MRPRPADLLNLHLWRTFLGRASLAALLILLLAPAALHARAEAEPDAARAALEADYDVLPVSDGWVLVPHDRDASFRSLEVREGRVAADGREIDREELAALVGEAASLRVLELSGQRAEPLEEPIVEAPEPDREEPRSSHGGDQFNLGPVTIEEGESVRDVTIIGGSLEVRGEVRGDAVVIGGSVEVHGTVGGAITSVGGSVILEPGSRVDGDITSVGGEVERESRAEVGGSIHSVPFFGFDFDLGDWAHDSSPSWNNDWQPGRLGWPWRFGDFGVFDVFEEVSETILLGVLALLVFLIAQRLVGAVAERAESDPWKAGMVGFLAQVVSVPLLVVVSLILVISIIGIPVLILLLPVVLLAAVLAFLCGFSGVALLLGRWLRGRFHWRDASPYTLVLAGVLLIKACSIAGEALSFGGGPIYLTALLILLLGVVVQYAAWTVGLGAFLLHKLSPARPVPAPPLLPEPPPEITDDIPPEVP